MLQKQKNKKLLYGCLGIFIILHLLCAFFWGTQKINYHVDEYFTYGLANNRGAIYPVIEDGKHYTGDEVFLNYLAPDESERFDYSTVWENQAADVHPPLYYIFIHTICSFFPGVFSKWEGLVFNGLCLIVIDILVFFLGRKIMHNDAAALAVAAAYGFSALCVNMSVFIRMYALMTVFIVASALLFVSCQKKQTVKFYAGFFLLSVCGTMTQYYFLIYLFFACLFFGIMLLAEKKWKEAGIFVGTLAAAGFSCIIIFPAMLEQIFGSGPRGQEAFRNARSLPNLGQHILAYFRIVNTELFGNCLLWLLFLAVGAVVIFGKIRHKKVKNIWQFCFLFWPSVCYCLVIAAIAPYQYDRYVMGIGPVLFMGVAVLVYEALRLAMGKKRRKERTVIMACLFLAVAVLSVGFSGWKPEYIYDTTKEKLAMAEEYGDYEVLFVYYASWPLMMNIQELPRFAGYTFVTQSELPAYLETMKEGPFVLYCTSSLDFDSIWGQIKAADAGVSRADELYSTTHPDYANIYFVH